jgi:hypothetical protein
MNPSDEQAAPDYAEDVHALDSLVEAVAGVRVLESRATTPAP